MSTSRDPPPPGYTNRSKKKEALPDYSSGSAYVIGGKTLAEPFVRVDQVKGHLSFLGAIHDLRTIIEAGGDTRIPKEALSLLPSQRWAWFAGLAVER